jgi:hypothetical protein
MNFPRSFPAGTAGRLTFPWDVFSALPRRIGGMPGWGERQGRILSPSRLRNLVPDVLQNLPADARSGPRSFESAPEPFQRSENPSARTIP